ncbi:MAG: NAD-dependent epimerase/dehydratase family protein, partial [Candidatus Omnitrophica bacterium]|nr:NAD-dependent epimerase/dehydratase family protein [Candidatus Omnitrophota bacterium]
MIIITGAAGFIGSAMCWALNKRGINDIIIVDEAILSHDKKANLTALKYSEYLSKEELIDNLKEARFKNIKAIIHLGACSNTTETDEKFLKRNNFEYTKTLCEYCIVKNARFIYASSAATYGDGKNGYSDEEKTIDTLKPLNLYGKSKQLFDVWAKNNGLLNKIVGLKYFNIFGPNEYHKGEMRSVVL